MIHEGGRAQAELSYLVSAAVAGAVGSWVFWGPQGSKYSRRRGTQLRWLGEERARIFPLFRWDVQLYFIIEPNK